MAQLKAGSFKQLRVWDGEHSRAFEEISFQLLTGRVPAGTQAIRTGNPDGGVEWYVTLPDGTEHGWQCKDVDGIDALLTAMTESVTTVAVERPALRELTFVISWNLATGKNAKDRKSQRQKYDDKVATWKRDIAGADEIEFHLVQESNLLDELAKPQHRGRQWFWWDNLVLGRDWLVTRYKEQWDAASDKYRPDLQVDLPIQDDLLALGFDQTIVDHCAKLVRDVIDAVADLHLRKDDDQAAAALDEAVQTAAEELRITAGAFASQAGDPASAFTPLLDQIAACRQLIRDTDKYDYQRQEAWRQLAEGDPAKGSQPPEQVNRYSLRELARALDALTDWLDSSAGQTFRQRTYFLNGPAGSGKTHLFLDATKKALDAGRPAVFLAGIRLGQGNLWASVTDQLGLDPVGADVLLSAMDAAGEAAALTGRRFVIFIDALNETVPPDFWNTQLPALRAAVARYPHVALAVSCRDTYLELVLEGKEGGHYVRQSHPGFAEREVEATQKYFAHYGLPAPKFPLLTPEFTLPLFLRLYCESFSQADGEPVPADGHEGRVTIFERYLMTKLSRIARRFRPAATSDYELNAARRLVSTVLDALLDELSRTGRESMTAVVAEAIASTALGDAQADAPKLLGLLQEEGVLTREQLYLGNDTYGEGVRIVFQAFSDFLLLKRRLAQSADPLNDPDVKTWLADASSYGIIEAATVLFPEAYGVELPDLLGLTVTAQPSAADDRAAWDRYNRTYRLYRSLVEMLPYRASRAITQRTIALLNDAQPYFRRNEFYEILFILAPQPDNRLNGEGLHHYLLQRGMPERDSDFGFATYYELSEGFSPAARLARWAAAGPYPDYDQKVIELACIPLCWLLSSPNRFMRDWVTKALVQLLRGHLDVVHALFERFWMVDDPYVIQRVTAIAYGALLRSTPTQATQAKALAELVLARVFARPVRPDELLLDAARGIARWAVACQLLPPSALDTAKRPYGLKPPGPPPTEATLEAKYGRRENEPDTESYGSLRLSLMYMGDFARYVVESGLHHFSRYRTTQAYPEQDREPRFIQSKWSAFVSSLTEAQQASLEDWLENPEEAKLGRIGLLIYGAEDSLTEGQLKLFDAVFVYPKRVNDEYPVDGAKRWIFRRTISLGWTPQRFGHQDRSLEYHNQGREAHKSERWGKKYQWMAYHELLARVADNFHPSRRFDDDQPYEGLHQIIGDREIDPSLPPIDFHAFNERRDADTAAWQPPMIQLAQWPPVPLDFKSYRGGVGLLVADTASEPTVADTLFVRDADGIQWVVLDGFMKQADPQAYKGWRGLQQTNGLDTLLVPKNTSKTVVAALQGESSDVARHLVDTNGHVDCCYVGEVGRSGPSCYHRHDQLRNTLIGDKTFRAVPTVEQYMWEGSLLDCSIGESASTVLPSTFIQRAAGLSFDMRGPSWLDADGRPVFTYYEEPGNASRALLVRADFLQGFLTKHKLELIVLHWFERMELNDRHDGNHPRTWVTTNARLTASLRLHVDTPKRTEYGMD